MTKKFWRNSFFVFMALFIITNIAWQLLYKDVYERGKIDGQLLVFEKWGHYSDETVEQLVDCIHLRAIYVFDSLGSHYDSTDTMPAVEKEE